MVAPSSPTKSKAARVFRFLALCVAVGFGMGVPTHLLLGALKSAEMVESNDNMRVRAVDNEYWGIHQLEKGDGDAAAEAHAMSAQEEEEKGGMMTLATSLEEDSDSKESSEKVEAAAELVEEQLRKKAEAEATTQDNQIIGNDSNEPYEQMFIKMEAENKRLEDKLNRKQEQINLLQQKLSLHEPKSELEKTLMTDLARSSYKVKDEVMNLIINTYASPSSPDKTFEKLFSAFEAIDFKYTDGEPVQVKGYPFLYVGSVGASLNRKSLVANNITHVVNWSSTARCNVFKDIKYRCILGLRGRSDMSRMNNVKKLRDAVEFVERARIAGGNVMSHCWYGRNRSVTLLVAWLMKYEEMGIDEATALIAETRPQADPYVEALDLYKKNYLDKKV